MNSFTKYVAFGGTVGFFRKSINVIFYDPKINVSNEYDFEKRDRKIVNRSMLVTEKVSTIVAHSAICSVYWPYFMTKDFIEIEAALRKVDMKRDDYADSYIWHILN